MTNDVKLAVAGAGLVGKRHVESISAVEGVSLACVVDPDPAGKAFAEKKGVLWYSSIGEMFDKAEVDGVIIATPNQLHLENALDCIAVDCPALIEKPVAVNVSEAEQIVTAAKSAGVPMLTGHHRRHNGLVKKAKSIIDEGTLGTIVSVQATCWLYKPDDYFNTGWRSKQGAGPVFINLVHDIDMLRHLCGDVASIQALESSMVRGFEVEDTAAIMLRFQNGALGTINVSDTAVAPWSWEMTARENLAYPATSEACYMIGGTKASLSLPNLTLWRNEGKRSWWNPLNGTKIPFDLEDPLHVQIKQFAAVIRGEQTPLVSAEEGLKTLRVIEAIKHAAGTGETVRFEAD